MRRQLETGETATAPEPPLAVDHVSDCQSKASSKLIRRLNSRQISSRRCALLCVLQTLNVAFRVRGVGFGMHVRRVGRASCNQISGSGVGTLPKEQKTPRYTLRNQSLVKTIGHVSSEHGECALRLFTAPWLRALARIEACICRRIIPEKNKA